jgi:hypothetical protein
MNGFVMESSSPKILAVHNGRDAATISFLSSASGRRHRLMSNRALAHRADRNASARMTSHAVMTSAATAPAVILAFSFAVVPRIQRLPAAEVAASAQAMCLT